MSGEFKNGVPIRANRKTINLINKLDITQTLMLNESIRQRIFIPTYALIRKPKQPIKAIKPHQRSFIVNVVIT